MFTATMPVWIGILIVVVWSALVVVAMLLAINKHRTMELLAANKQKVIDKIMQERNEAREQRDRLNEENESLHQANGVQAKQNLDLYKQNAKLREDLTEAKSTVQLLRMPSEHATVPLVEAAPMAYSEAKPAIEQAAQSTPKRTKRGKITGGAQ